MTLRLGVIGTGAIGKDHIRRCNRVLSGASVVAVADADAAAARAVAAVCPDARVHASGQALIRAAEVDAVIVTTWGSTHEPFVLEAIAAGKYVFCEKPLATTATACRTIVDAEMRFGKRLVQVGFMRPYDEGYRALRAVVAGGQIGAPLMVHCAHRNASVAESYTTEMAVTDTLVHELDVLRWVLDDDYINCQVIFPRRSPHAAAHLRDPQIVLLETAKGVRIDVEIFVNCRYGYDIQCEVVGETGTARLPDPDSVSVRSQALRSQAILTDWKDRFVRAYDVELQAFIDGVGADRLSGPSAWDGYAAAVATDACVKAQSSGAIVPIEITHRPAFYNRLE